MAGFKGDDMLWGRSLLGYQKEVKGITGSD